MEINKQRFATESTSKRKTKKPKAETGVMGIKLKALLNVYIES